LKIEDKEIEIAEKVLFVAIAKQRRSCAISALMI